MNLYQSREDWHYCIPQTGSLIRLPGAVWTGVRPRSSSSQGGVVMWTHLESSCRTIRQSSLLPLQGVSHPYPDEGGRGGTGQDVGMAAALGAPLVGILWEVRAS